MADNTSQLIIQLRQQGADEVAGAITKVSQSLKGIDEKTKIVIRDNQILDNGMMSVQTTLGNVNGKWQETGKVISSTTTNMRRFKMEYLSVLFFAMNAQRQLQRVIVGSVSAFTSIAGSTNKTNQAFASLNANITYLKFTLGEAFGSVLEALLPTFIGFIEAITDFVEQHPEEVAWGLASAFGLMAAAGIGSQLVLLGSGVSQIASGLGNIDPAKIDMLKKLGGILAIGWSIKSAYDAISMEGIQWGDIAQSAVFTGIGLKYLGMEGATAAKFGGWVGLILIAFEFAANPEDTGKFLADASNFVLRLLEGFIAIMDALNPGKWFANYMQGKSMIDVNAFQGVFEGWGDSFLLGFQNEIDALKASGKLSKTLSSVTNFGEDWAAAEPTGTQGFFGGFGTAVKNLFSGFSDQTKEETAKAKMEWDTFVGGIANIAGTILLPLFNNLGFMIGSPTAGSFPIVYSLKLAEAEWVKMANISITQINMIIARLNAIPRNITTTHTIRTVYTSSGKSSKGYAVGTEYVPRTGVYTLHQGEKVVPSNTLTMGNINVSAQTNASAQDIARLISDQLNDELRRFF